MQWRNKMKKYILLFFSFILIIAFSSLQAEEKFSDGVKRISVEQARADVLSGKALLVCSYDDRRCEELLIKGAILKSELEAKLPSLSKDQEIIFYCA